VAEPIDGSTATPAALRRAGIDAQVRALGPVGMAGFLQQFDPGQRDYTANRDRWLRECILSTCTELFGTEK
jgi:hypothetical protein